MARGTCGDKVAQNVKNTLTDWEIVTLRSEGREGRTERELGLEGRQAVSDAAKVLSLSPPCILLHCGSFQPSEPTRMFWAPSPSHSSSPSPLHLHNTHLHTFTSSHSSSHLHPHLHTLTLTLTLTHGGPARRSRSGKNCAVSDA